MLSEQFRKDINDRENSGVRKKKSVYQRQITNCAGKMLGPYVCSCCLD